MSKYTFHQEFAGQSPDSDSEIIIRFETTDLGTLIENFEAFLKACGFNWEGELDFVTEGKNNQK
jgi:hypothetical protein